MKEKNTWGGSGRNQGRKEMYEGFETERLQDLVPSECKQEARQALRKFCKTWTENRMQRIINKNGVQYEAQFVEKLTVNHCFRCPLFGTCEDIMPCRAHQRIDKRECYWIESDTPIHY